MEIIVLIELVHCDSFIIVVVVQSLSRDRLCHLMDCSTLGFSVLHHLLELAQTHVCWVGDVNPTISSSVVPFSCLQSFPASGYFPVSWFFASGGQSISLSISLSREYSGLISFAGEVMSLLFNTLSKFVIAFLPRSKNLKRSESQSWGSNWWEKALLLVSSSSVAHSSSA